MPTIIRFFVVAAYELIIATGQHILIDPFLDGNPGSPVKSAEFPRVDLILVSHAAVDHLGDTEAIARRTGAPIICGGEVNGSLHAASILSRIDMHVARANSCRFRSPRLSSGRESSL